MITGCEKENSPVQVDTTSTGQDLQQQIEDRITELVEGATDDKILQAEMREELRFLIDSDITVLNTLTIRFYERDNDFEYLYHGDISASRRAIQENIQYLNENPSLSTRSHK